MAIVYHQATLTPGKLELITDWLDRQPWGGSGEVTLVGAYRLDDPAGEVGIEGHLLRRGALLLHVPVSYRGAPLEDSGAELLGRSQHSLLGERWFYDATTDPVGIGCLVRAARGEQEQAVYELYEGETVVGTREPSVVLSSESADGTPVGADVEVAVVGIDDGGELRLARVVGGDVGGGEQRLRARWHGGEAMLASVTAVR